MGLISKNSYYVALVSFNGVTEGKSYFVKSIVSDKLYTISDKIEFIPFYLYHIVFVDDNGHLVTESVNFFEDIRSLRGDIIDNILL